MGNCAGSGWCGLDNSDINKFELEGALVKKFSKDELHGRTIQIGDNQFESPLTRNAMLSENYSHIYDLNFE